jgi:LemA protein
MMSVLALSLIIALAVAVLVGLWFVGAYNQLVKLKALVQEAWSGIDVQLKRRYDLVPNLVQTVKGYAGHEKSVFENVAKMRSQAMNAQGVEHKAEAEQGLTGALKSLFAVAENYPELKANENFLQLQKDLNAIEHEIQLSRRYYNGTVRNYNIVVQSFPTNIVAGMFGFAKRPYFELDDSQERSNPDVSF